MPPPSTKLAAQKFIVSQIEQLHSEILEHARTSLDKAIKIGELLSSIKPSVGHGNWLTWLKLNVPFSERTATNYIRCFTAKEHLKSASIADLHGALELLTIENNHPPVPKPNVPAPKLVATPKPTAPQPVSKPLQPVAKPVSTPAPIFKEKILDGTGFVIPEHLLPLWRRNQDTQDLLTYISNVRGALKKAEESKDALYAEVSFSSIQAHLDQAYAELKTAKMFAVCTTCKGKEMLVEGCTDCKGRGFMSQFFYENLVPIETRQMREENLS